MYSFILTINFGVVFFVIIVFGLLRWLQIPTGSFLDWIIAVAIFEWLLVIVTVPWNIYFSAKEVMAEAALSEDRGISIDHKQLQYTKQVAKFALGIAIALHLLSAIGLYSLALAGISVLGYLGSGAALLLTVLRPAIQAYQYLAVRLSTIREQIKYPREDVVELRNRVNHLEQDIKTLQSQMDPENPNAWVTIQDQQWQSLRNQLTTLSAEFQTLRSQNQAEHERLSLESRQAISQLTTDGQFLEQVREIIRFFKSV